jgi:hypothetical protein
MQKGKKSGSNFTYCFRKVLLKFRNKMWWKLLINEIEGRLNHKMNQEKY